MSDDLNLRIRLSAENAALRRGLSSSQRSVRSFSSVAKREIAGIKRMWQSTAGKLAGLGLGVGLTAMVADSAKLDKGLIKIRQTAGATITQQVQLRRKLHQWSRRTGDSIEDLKEGFNGLVQSGQSWGEAMATMEGVNVAMGVTGAQAQVLGKALTVAGTAFDFDLSKPGRALELLDQMTVAGRLGNAELEDLSAVFGRIGVNARTAGMGFEKTLAFVEGLSMIERAPERLATLADSTLRLFTNARYAARAQKTTGVRFFDAKGARRDAMAVLADMKTSFDQLRTDAQKTTWIQEAFGAADLDTIKGLRLLLSGDMLTRIGGFTQQISAAGGTLEKDLAGAIDNAYDSSRRLKSALKEAADGFATPFKKGVNRAAKWALDEANLSGGQMIGLGAAGLAASYFGGRLLKGGVGKLLSRFGKTGAGVAEGKALEKMAGVTPVYVVNMPGSGMGNGGSAIPGLGGAAAGGKGAAAAAGFGVAAPLVAAGLVGGGLYAMHKQNQHYTKTELARQAYRNREYDDLIDVETGKAYRPKAGNRASGIVSVKRADTGRELSPDEIEQITAGGEHAVRLTDGDVNVTVHIDSAGRVQADADGMNVNTQVDVPHGPLVIYQGEN